MTLVLHTLEQSRAFGRLLGQTAEPGDVICLCGDLGAGKTTLTQAIAQGLDVPEQEYVTSPSFAIFHEYPGRMPLYHMDFYRLSSADEVLAMGLDEYLYLQGLTVIEWSERAEELIPPARLKIYLTIGPEESRIIKADLGTGGWQQRYECLLHLMQPFLS